MHGGSAKASRELRRYSGVMIDWIDSSAASEGKISAAKAIRKVEVQLVHAVRMRHVGSRDHA